MIIKKKLSRKVEVILMSNHKIDNIKILYKLIMITSENKIKSSKKIIS